MEEKEPTIEEIREQLLQLKDELTTKEEKLSAMEKEIAEKQERINSLVDTNSKLYQRIATPIEETKNEPNQLENLIEGLKKVIK